MQRAKEKKMNTLGIIRKLSIRNQLKLLFPHRKKIKRKKKSKSRKIRMLKRRRRKTEDYLVEV